MVWSRSIHFISGKALYSSQVALPPPSTRRTGMIDRQCECGWNTGWFIKSGHWVGLAQIWDVPPYCLGRK